MEENKEYEIPGEIEELAESIGGGWFNFRLVEKERYWKDLDGKENCDVFYEIHEIYYRSDGSIWAWSQEPISLYFENKYDYKDTLSILKEVYKKPILKLIPKSDIEDEKLIKTNKYIKNIK